MFQFLCVFGPAAVTYLVLHHCLGRRQDRWFDALAELLCYAFLDAAVTFCCMAPIGKASLVLLADGSKELQYSGIAFLFALFAGAVCGVVLAAVRKRLEVRVEVEPRKKDGGDEAEKDT